MQNLNAIGTEDFDRIRTMVRQQTGIVLEENKRYLIESRLSTLVRKEGIESIDALLSQLRVGGSLCELHGKIVEAMTTNETSFFRDGHPFEALRRFVLPELLRLRAKEKRLRIWCAAASTGQEPYSLAMLLREQFAASLLGWNVQILATDFSPVVLDVARRGRFNAIEMSRGLTMPYQSKYFRQVDASWEIHESIRTMIEFRPLNLIGTWPAMLPYDLILLRNVLIYFDLATKQTVLRHAKKVLRGDGYLFLGGAETTLNIDAGYVRETVGDSVCYRPRG